ncbi:MAG: pyrimidine reductase [Chloroflexi bacterium RBG_16_48_8]|nr:MAG: pyrimidine reductase [Chloroflexi bacterium RBG_16_48_8]
MENIIQLYPGPTQEVPIKNLYLSTPLHEIILKEKEILVYSNFITSLDGRIAVTYPAGGGMTIPREIANPRDWRLVQELTVQADLVITSGRYLREVAEGHGQKILRVYEDPPFADLKDWREMSGMKLWPDLAIISNSLDFPIPEFLTHGDRAVMIVTTNHADPRRVKALESQGGKVILAGEDHVSGKELVKRLTGLGYQRVYSLTGPKVLHLLLEADVLDRLYLTIANRILGGESFSSIVEGGLFQPSRGFRLRTLYYDPHGLDGLGQLFACYDRARISG